MKKESIDIPNEIFATFCKHYEEFVNAGEVSKRFLRKYKGLNFCKALLLGKVIEYEKSFNSFRIIKGIVLLYLSAIKKLEKKQLSEKEFMKLAKILGKTSEECAKSIKLIDILSVLEESLEKNGNRLRSVHPRLANPDTRLSALFGRSAINTVKDIMKYVR